MGGIITKVRLNLLEFLYLPFLLNKLFFHERKEIVKQSTFMYCVNTFYLFVFVMQLDDFEWDDDKALSNCHKHGISFDEAMTVFYDDEALLLADPDHSYQEERFILLGTSQYSNILVVVHCERGERIRIISARKATKSEKSQYLRGII